MKIATALSLCMVLSFVNISFAECPSADLNGDCEVDFNDLAILASQWLDKGVPEPEGIIWININDPGVPGHEPFIGQMSRHEITNAQFCFFLNAALASGDVIVDGDDVNGANGANPGEDCNDCLYYYLAGPGEYVDGATNGGASRINYDNGFFTVDSGFENHPVTYVTWYGATAFCNYFGYRLPTEWEWQAVADYDGTFVYGCGTSINNDIANYLGSNHPYGTTEVGQFGSYGYTMCDMAGNVIEWTSTRPERLQVILRGGAWSLGFFSCQVDQIATGEPGGCGSGSWGCFKIGFRVCR